MDTDPLDLEVIAPYNECMTAQKARQQARGRPREFDVEAAVDGALTVFRDRGFHEASLVELGAAMRLTPGSIYKAFRDKGDLFRAAFDRYRQLRDERLSERLATRTNAREKIAETLNFYSELASGLEGRLGCLVVGAATDFSTLDADSAARVTETIARNEKFLSDLIVAGHADRSIPASVDPASTAAALLCITQGMRVIGKLGRTRSQMAAIVDAALRMLD